MNTRHLLHVSLCSIPTHHFLHVSVYSVTTRHLPLVRLYYVTTHRLLHVSLYSVTTHHLPLVRLYSMTTHHLLHVSLYSVTTHHLIHVSLYSVADYPSSFISKFVLCDCNPPFSTCKSILCDYPPPSHVSLYYVTTNSVFNANCQFYQHSTVLNCACKVCFLWLHFQNGWTFILLFWLTTIISLCYRAWHIKFDWIENESGTTQDALTLLHS